MEKHIAKCDKCGKEEDMIYQSKSSYSQIKGWFPPYRDGWFAHFGKLYCPKCHKELTELINKWKN